MDEFSAIAFPRSARSSIISITKAWRAGMSKALIMPWNSASADHPRQVQVTRERQSSHRQRLHHRQDLGDHQDAMAVPAIQPDAGDRRHEERRDLAQEAGESQEKRGIGELVDDPAGGKPGHPRADERNALAGEKQAVVARSQGCAKCGPTLWWLRHPDNLILPLCSAVHSKLILGGPGSRWFYSPRRETGRYAGDTISAQALHGRI